MSETKRALTAATIANLREMLLAANAELRTSLHRAGTPWFRDRVEMAVYYERRIRQLEETLTPAAVDDEDVILK